MKTKTLGALVAGFLLINLFLIGWAISHNTPPELRVAFLDVGQGDACVLETPTGKSLSSTQAASLPKAETTKDVERSRHICEAAELIALML